VAVIEAISRQEPDLVVHAAAQVSVAHSMAKPDDDRRINVIGTRNVIEGCRAAEAERLVFISSGGAIYGNNPAGSETSLPLPESYYAVHKYVAERYGELSGLSYAIARLANVYGAGQRAGLEGGVVAIFMDALTSGSGITIHGTGEQRRDFVHVGDVVGALVSMATSRRDGTWNVGTGSSISISQLLGVMQAAIAPAGGVDYSPRRDGDVLESRLVVTRIAEELGWRPSTTLQAGVESLAP
jgi:UDP-glucose 4-epimerase